MPNIRGVLNSSSMSDYVLSRCLYLISNINIVIILWCYYKYISLPYPFKKNQVEIKKIKNTELCTVRPRLPHSVRDLFFKTDVKFKFL